MADRSQRLAIIVTAQDLASGKLGKVKGELTQLGATGKLAALGLGTAGLAANKAGAAFGTLRGRVSGLMGSIGPLLGVGGLLGLTSLLSSSVRNAAEFGAGVSKVTAVTGLSAGTASAMVDTLDKWGITSDKLVGTLAKHEKAVGTLASTKAKAIAFEKQYGLSLLSANGQVADANELLLRSSDYFNSNATAGDKAVVMAKLWGKSWQDLIPILSKGSAMIRDEEANSIHLTDTQLKNIDKFRNAQRDFSDAFGDVQVKIGSELMPLLTSGLKEASTWFDAHGDDIAGFFRDAAAFAGQAASGAIGVFSAVKSGWDTLPKPLRDFLVTGLVVDRTAKFLFGVSPAKLVVDVAGKGIASAIGGSLGGFFARGSPANPMFTKEVGLAGVAGGGGAAAAGGMGLASKVFLIGEAIGLALLVNEVRNGIADGNTKTSEAIQTQTQKWLAQNPSRTDLINGLAAVDKGINDIQANPLNVLVQGEALDNLRTMRELINKQITAEGATVAHPGGVDSPRTVAVSAAAVEAILKRGRAAGFNPTLAAAEATNQRNVARAAEKQQQAADRLISAALIQVRAAERLERLGNITITARGFGGAPPRPLTPGRRVDDTGGGRQSGVLHGGGNAAGLLGFTRGPTHIGYAGEAGGEAIAILRNPRPIHGSSSGGASIRELLHSLPSTVVHVNMSTADVQRSRTTRLRIVKPHGSRGSLVGVG